MVLYILIDQNSAKTDILKSMDKILTLYCTSVFADFSDIFAYFVLIPSSIQMSGIDPRFQQ